VRQKETITQALHRLTSFQPGCDWSDPLDVGADARLLQDLEILQLELDRIPWPYKRYAWDRP
jgi:hypothetical protein